MLCRSERLKYLYDDDIFQRRADATFGTRGSYAPQYPQFRKPASGPINVTADVLPGRARHYMNQ